MTIHSIPGRLRLRHMTLRNSEVREQLRRHAGRLSGIQELDINPRTASLLVRYDPQVLDSATLHATLEQLVPGAARPASSAGHTHSLSRQLSRDERKKLAYAMLTSLGTSLLALLVHGKKAHVIAGCVFLAGLGLHLSDKKKFLCS
ncbi:HMA2 domain-containing protein [Geoalkalibacter halelectricus]|uniref:HMA domain-containing protein n=1 Tax=Geoalkalibacter halelectricus TaxID=2847045 RepID=A0ABY5ZQN0_9BACT|nr:hypothetical protein [Geoalkalibacter halelectricus]MDO3377692.1 hypothetical protein [Geoalkalibacter halelectricus]UWZ81480.1 hypothetical protein L9S41_08810 [Geoalkalibacter halelectricus]